jgi:hypothetical protein
MLARIFFALTALIWLPYGIYCFFRAGYLCRAAGVAATTTTGTIELQRDVRRSPGGIGAFALACRAAPALVPLGAASRRASCSRASRDARCSPRSRRELLALHDVGPRPRVGLDGRALLLRRTRLATRDGARDRTRASTWRRQPIASGRSCCDLRELSGVESVRRALRLDARGRRSDRDARALCSVWPSRSASRSSSTSRPSALCYGLAAVALGALASRRSHEVEPLSASARATSRTSSCRGWLAPLVYFLLARRLARDSRR